MGKIDDKVSVTTLQHNVVGFISAFRRKTGSTPDENLESQALAYVDSILTKEGGIVRGRLFRPIPDGEVISGE